MLTKTECRAISPEGWSYTGSETKKKGRKKQTCYYYQKGSYATGFCRMKCFEEDMHKANLEAMAEDNLSR